MDSRDGVPRICARTDCERFAASHSSYCLECTDDPMFLCHRCRADYRLWHSHVSTHLAFESNRACGSCGYVYCGPHFERCYDADRDLCENCTDYPLFFEGSDVFAILNE